MKEIFIPTRQLVETHWETINLERQINLKNWLSVNNYEIDFFDSDFEHLYDIYKIRQEGIQERGQFIDGLAELVSEMENHPNLAQIRLTSFQSEQDEILLFSDPDYTIFLGILVFENQIVTV